MTNTKAGPALKARRLPLLLLVCTAILLVPARPPASAHLAFPEYHSIKTTLTADAEGIRLQVVVEIPLADLILAFNQHFAHLDLISEIEKGNIESLEADFRDAMFERLAKGLEATANGDDLPEWKPAPDPVNGRAGEGFFIYILETRYSTRPGDLSVEFINELFPEKELVLANLVLIQQNLAEPAWQVIESSTPQPPAGTDLTEGTASELELWSDESEKRRFFVRLKLGPKGDAI